VHLEVSTFLVQWATGGLAFLWVTGRRRVVGLGYGWLLRGVFGALAVLGVVAAIASGAHGTGATIRVAGAVGLVVAATVALVVSLALRHAGVGGLRAQRAARVARVAAMLGREAPSANGDRTEQAREFPPSLDLVAPAFGVIALAGAAAADGGPYPLTFARFVVGAAFLGVVTDAMLLGHWYLVQPGLSRAPIKELVRLTAFVWPVEVALLLIPTGMVQVLNGTIDDGYGGLLGWTWVVCVVTTIALVATTWFALRERFYSAVMAATGLLYLAILTAFGVDVLARAVLSP